MSGEAINKYSYATDGRTPNLVPGSVGFNFITETFYMRRQGKVEAISIDKWRSRAATRRGAQVDAPLVMMEDGPAWDPSLTPSSVVDGRVRVDNPPGTGQYAIPGVQITGIGSDMVFTPGPVIVERFYVASDAIQLQRIGFMLKFQNAPGIFRLGVARDDNEIIAQGAAPSPLIGAMNGVAVGVRLERGWYKLVLWSESAATFGSVEGIVAEQGWTLDGAGAPQFSYREDASTSTFTSTMNLANVILTDRTRPDPGVGRMLLAQWNYPAE